MKNFFMAVASVALLLGACTSKKSSEFKVTATGLPSEANGTYAYIYDVNNQIVDSIMIENGSFTFTAPANDSIINMVKLMDIPMLFAREAGDFTFTIATDSVSGETTIIRSGDATSGFMKIQNLNNELTTAHTKYRDEIKAISETILTPDSTLTAEQETQIDSLYTALDSELANINKRYFTEASNACIQIVALKNLRRLIEPAEFIGLFDQAPESLKTEKSLSDFYKTSTASVNTGVGKQFIDYQMTNPAGGETKMLSEFRTEGKYFLLDFFASWCGPCKRSMPVLAEIEKQYSNMLSSASIAIWERDETGAAYEEAKKNLNITWPSFQDGYRIDGNNKSVGAETYGVIGVPTFILFSPEGEIIVRTHDVNEVKTKLEELNK